jgi:hypothetical protein
MQVLKVFLVRLLELRRIMSFQVPHDNFKSLTIAFFCPDIPYALVYPLTHLGFAKTYCFDLDFEYCCLGLSVEFLLHGNYLLFDSFVGGCIEGVLKALISSLKSSISS